MARLHVAQPEQLAYMTQTTLSVDDTAAIVARAARRFPASQAPRREDICYATQNRQDAVQDLLRSSAIVLMVVGSRNSSNSNRLRELADRAGMPGYWWTVLTICSANGWMARRPWVSPPGASAPEVLVQQVVQRLRSWGAAGAGGARRARGAGGIRPAEGAARLTRREAVMSPGRCRWPPLGGIGGFAGRGAIMPPMGNRPPALNLTGTRAAARLAACGIRVTDQRLQIASILLVAPQHLSAEQIADALRATARASPRQRSTTR